MSLLHILGMMIDTVKTGATFLWEIAAAVPVASASIIVIVAVAVIYLFVGR